ncbi:MAG: response regulator [Thermodesulfobacteriota bacterium]
MTKTLQLLLVDDEKDFLDATEKRLLRRGYAVETATDCAGAGRILENRPVDVVILDVMLPDRSGLLLLKEIRQKWPRTAVLLLSGHASIQCGVQGIEHGAYDYCLKPIELDELVDKIELARRDMPPPAGPDAGGPPPDTRPRWP